jgi:glutathione S-transferase
MQLKLISFTLCPYVQRAVLALEEKGVDYDIEYIDLGNKPDWFLAKSPRGKVPILLVDDDTVLFESQPIVEFLDETQGDRLASSDPVLRARERAWFNYSGEELFMALWMLQAAKDPEGLEEQRGKATDVLGRFETELEGRQWFSGDGTRFGLADVAVAPALTHMAHIATHGVDLLAGFSNLQSWADRVRARPAFPKSVPAAWGEVAQLFMQGNESALLR